MVIPGGSFGLKNVLSNSKEQGHVEVKAQIWEELTWDWSLLGFCVRGEMTEALKLKIENIFSLGKEAVKENESWAA